MTGDVLLSSKLPDALLSPQKATFDVLDKKLVCIVDEHKVTHLREVSVVHGLQKAYAVKSGIVEDELILLEGLRKVRDGQHIATTYQNPEDVMAMADTLLAE